MGAPAPRIALSKLPLISLTAIPASGFAAVGKVLVTVRLISETVADAADATDAAEARFAGAPAVGADGAGAGTAGLAATELEEEAVFATKAPMAQVSLCGVKVTLSPFMPETSLPLMVVGPEPRSELSGLTVSVNGPPLFCTWMRNCVCVFSTV